MNTRHKSRIVAGAVLACLALSPPSSVAQAVPDPDVAQMPPPAPRSSAVARTLMPTETVAELKRGGYVIYFRHTSTDFSQNDTQSKGYADCAHQRNLTEGEAAVIRGLGDDNFEVVARIRVEDWPALTGAR